jgi:hypothetical protein
MPAILGLFPSALIGAKNGMSANAFVKEMRDLGMGARRAEMLSLYRIAKSIVVKSPDEAFQDITQVPSGDSVLEWPSKGATGIRQVVTLVYRDRTTGAQKVTHWSTTSPEGITREQAMATAINAYSDHADAYNQDLIGAVHSSAYQYVPFTV